MSAQNPKHQGDTIPFLRRRPRPKPKLSITIPNPESPQPGPKLVGHVQYYRSSTPELHTTGATYAGSLCSSPALMTNEQRMMDRADLQTSGDGGWNDYLHWYQRHPGEKQYPRMSWDECSCSEDEDERSRSGCSCPECEDGAQEKPSQVPDPEPSVKLRRDLIVSIASISAWLLLRGAISKILL